MGEAKKSFTCYSCDSIDENPNYCDGCDSWGTKIFHIHRPAQLELVPSNKPKSRFIKMSEIKSTNLPRYSPVVIDACMGGGFVIGSSAMISGEPGIGKSTLLLQVVNTMVENGGSAVYGCFEEAHFMVKARYERLFPTGKQEGITLITNPDDCIEALVTEKPQIIIIDSITAIEYEIFDSIIKKCRNQKTVAIFVAHVNKSGEVAGLKRLEHDVDAVLMLQGERDDIDRDLIVLKNRFGPPNVTQSFRMTDKGLIPS